MDVEGEQLAAALAASLRDAGPPPSSTASPWRCDTCTLINPPTASSCEACNTARPPWICVGCSLKNPHSSSACSICMTPRPADEGLFIGGVPEVALSDAADEAAALRDCVAADAALPAPTDPAAAHFPSVAHADSTFHLAADSISDDCERAAAFVQREVGDRLALQTLRAAGLLDVGTGTALLPLRTIGDGNCLLHATAQSLWGVQDAGRSLRSVLAHALIDDACASMLRARWQMEAERLDATLPVEFRAIRQWDRDWEDMSTVLGLAAGEHTPAGSRVSIGQSSLEALHVFAVAQVLRRPLIVYADDRRSAESGDGMSGIYLPSLISPEERSRLPLLLAYIPEHFVSVVPLRPASQYVPLVTKDGYPLPVRFEADSFSRSQLSDFMDVLCDKPGLPRECVELPARLPLADVAATVQERYHSGAAARLKQHAV